MRIIILPHARARMEAYGITDAQVLAGLENPHSIVESHSARRVAQRRLNDYVLRIVYEEEDNFVTVITVYKARSARYEI